MSNTNPDQQTTEQMPIMTLRDLCITVIRKQTIQQSMIDNQEAMLDAIKLAQGEHERKIKSLSWFLLANLLTTIALLIIGLCLQKAF